MKGRKPKDRNLRLVEGNRGKRPVNNDEPQFEKGVTCPEQLQGLAKEEWDRLAPLLEEQGLLTKADVAMYAGYCFSYALLLQAFEEYNKNPQAKVETKRGNEKTNPAIVVANNAIQNIKAISSVFGFAPGDRQRIKVDKKTQTLEDLLANDD